MKENREAFVMPEGPELAERLAAVLHVIYLVFNEGYFASHGDSALRADLTDEAGYGWPASWWSCFPRRSRRACWRCCCCTPRGNGLASMLPGEPVLLEDQDRSLWHAGLIAEGSGLSRAALVLGAGPYALQAAIAAMSNT